MQRWRERSGWAIAAVLGLLVVAAVTGVVSGGPLDPTGAPGPTMKTLQEVEPRTPISALPYTISQPGSYYLTGNLTGTVNANGIAINADNVELDLGGFTMTGLPSSFAAIIASSPRTNITIRHGTIASFPDGVALSTSTGVTINDVEVRAPNLSLTALGAVQTGTGGRLSDCRIEVHSGRNGAVLGDDARVSRCSVRNVSEGIVVGADSVVEDCEVEAYVLTGVFLGDRSTARNCTLRTTAGATNGILALNQAVVAGNRVATGGAGAGIAVQGQGTEVSGNHISNVQIGIVLGSSAANAAVYENTIVDAGYGIFVDAPRAVVHGNRMTNGATGVALQGSLASVYQNTITNVSTPISDGGTNNQVAPLQAAGSATNPWANLVNNQPTATTTPTLTATVSPTPTTTGTPTPTPPPTLSPTATPTCASEPCEF